VVHSKKGVHNGKPTQVHTGVQSSSGAGDAHGAQERNSTKSRARDQRFSDLTLEARIHRKISSLVWEWIGRKNEHAQHIAELERLVGRLTLELDAAHLPWRAVPGKKVSKYLDSR
jgi:hypothetical protein